jgi:hypothetical protein
MRLRHWIAGIVILVGLGLAWAWYAGYFDKSVGASAQTKELSQKQTGDLTEALQLAKAAQVKLQGWAGYRCAYLRDERIDNEMQQNSLRLIVRHEPFSANMEWVEPRAKQGRKAIYVAGKNDNKMLFKLLVTLRLDPSESIKRKESRHTILEVGLKNMMDRFVKAWEAEMSQNETAVAYSDEKVNAVISDKHFSHVCRLVETTHPVETKGKFVFYRTKIYFDRSTGLPVRMEGYDWPTPSDPNGRLLERYTYMDVTTEPVPSDADFQM